MRSATNIVAAMLHKRWKPSVTPSSQRAVLHWLLEVENQTLVDAMWRRHAVGEIVELELTYILEMTLWRQEVSKQVLAVNFIPKH